MVLKFILIGGVLPGFFCTVALLAAFFVGRRHRARGLLAALFPALVALSILPAYYLANEAWPRLLFLPKSAVDRTPHITFVAAIFGVLTALVAWTITRRRSSTIRHQPDPDRTPLLATILIAIPACATCFRILLSYRVPAFWKSPLIAAAWLALYTLAAVAMIVVFELASRRRSKIDTAARLSRDPAPILVLFIIANAIPFIALKTGNAFLSQLSGGIVAAIGAALFAAILIPGFALARGGFTTLVAALGSIGLAAFYLSSGDTPEPLLPMLCLAAAPFFAAGSLALFLRSASTITRSFISAAIAAAFTLAALVVLWAQSAPASPNGSTPTGYEMYE